MFFHINYSSRHLQTSDKRCDKTTKNWKLQVGAYKDVLHLFSLIVFGTAPVPRTARGQMWTTCRLKKDSMKHIVQRQLFIKNVLWECAHLQAGLIVELSSTFNTGCSFSVIIRSDLDSDLLLSPAARVCIWSGFSHRVSSQQEFFFLNFIIYNKNIQTLTYTLKHEGPFIKSFTSTVGCLVIWGKFALTIPSLFLCYSI